VSGVEGAERENYDEREAGVGVPAVVERSSRGYTKEKRRLEFFYTSWFDT